MRRTAPGLFYDHLLGLVFVFGGVCASKSLAECEKLAISSQSWTMMPSMLSARRYFNPCARQSVIYLVGGWTTSIETYTARTNSFSEVKLELREWFHCCSCTAVMHDDCLVVLSLDSMCVATRDLTEWRQSAHSPCMVWSNCAPTVINGCLFIVNMLDTVCRGISLATGEKEAEFSVWGETW